MLIYSMLELEQNYFCAILYMWQDFYHREVFMFQFTAFIVLFWIFFLLNYFYGLLLLINMKQGKEILLDSLF